MSLRIERRPQAIVDVDRIAHYITNHQLDAALRFIDQVERAILMLADDPLIGRERTELLPGLRSWPVRGFTNYIIFYFVSATAIDVVRVLHGARDLRSLFEAD